MTSGHAERATVETKPGPSPDQIEVFCHQLAGPQADTASATDVGHRKRPLRRARQAGFDRDRNVRRSPIAK
jgi:hypothetical protein